MLHDFLSVICCYEKKNYFHISDFIGGFYFTGLHVLFVHYLLQDEENLVIPIHAYPVMSTDDFPSRLDFPPVPVGHR